MPNDKRVGERKLLSRTTAEMEKQYDWSLAPVEDRECSGRGRLRQEYMDEVTRGKGMC